MGDGWLLDYDRAAGLGQEIMQAIVDCSRHPRDSTTYSKKSSSVQTSIQKFKQDLTALRDGLKQSVLRRKITDREADRRQAMMDQLATKQKQIELAYNSNDDHFLAQRSALLNSSTSSNPFEEDDPWSNSYAVGTASVVDDNMTIQQLRQQQERIIDEQDHGLDALSRIVGRQKEIALHIGNEVESQNDLIDDIHDHVDSTNTRLIRETQHVRVVDQKSNACWLYVVIVLLAVAIVVIAAVPFG